MKLVATQAYPYGRRALKAGDLFDADEDDARLLCGFGKARVHHVKVQGGYTAPPGDGVRPPLPTIGSGVIEPKPKKWQRGGRYNRSDVRASD